MVFKHIKKLKKLGEITGILPSEYKSEVTKILEKIGYGKTEYFCRNDLGDYPCEFTRYRGKKEAVLGNIVIVGNHATLSSNPSPYSLNLKSWIEICPAKNESAACSDVKTLEKIPKRRRRFHYNRNDELLNYLKEITK